GHTLESLAQHHKRASARVARAEVQIAEPAGATAMAPFGREHYQIERYRGFNLEPRAAARASLIGRVERFGHDSLMPRLERRLQEGLGFGFFSDDAARHQQALGHHACESRDALGPRSVENGDPVDIEAVEEERVDRNTFPEALDFELSAKAAHRHLKR